MKLRTTKKEVMRSFPSVIRVPYCYLDKMLELESPSGYTAGSYGWGADVYDFGNVAIVTGYSPFGNISPDRSLLNKYNEKADQILEYYSFDAGKAKNRLRELIAEFLTEVANAG